MGEPRYIECEECGENQAIFIGGHRHRSDGSPEWEWQCCEPDCQWVFWSDEDPEADNARGAQGGGE